MTTLPSLKNFLSVASSIALWVLMCTPVHAQWKKIPSSAIPRGADGKPNLAAPAPRLDDGRPDLSGIWASSGGDKQNPAKDVKTAEIPHQAWAKSPADESATGLDGGGDREGDCVPQGVPRT